MVFVGLRTYASTTYPASSMDSFIVAVAGLGYGITATEKMGTSATPIAAIDGLLSFGATATPIDLYKYPTDTPTNMGHMFCGL